MKRCFCIFGIFTLASLFAGSMVETLSAAQNPSEKESLQRSSLGGSVFGSEGIEIRDVKFETMKASSEGKLEFKGRVQLRSDQFDLDCELLIIDPQNKEMKAKGTPLNLRQGKITAQCKNLHYNVEKKRSRLTGKPKILERQEKQIITAWHDIITIDQGNDGVSWNMAPAPNSNNTGGINVEQINRGKDTPNQDDKSRKKSPQPIGDDIQLIKIPQRD